MKILSYKDILKDRHVVAIYKSIDKQNKKEWAKHGLSHIKTVLKNAKTLCKLFKINKKLSNLTFCACVLHDVGEVFGKENHWERSFTFAQKYLKDASFNSLEKYLVCDAIKNHYNSDDNSSLVRMLLVLSDKLDISRKRILTEGKKIEGMRQTQYIKQVKLQKIANLFQICVKTTKKFNKTEFLNYYFTKTLLSSATIFASNMHCGFKLCFC